MKLTIEMSNRNRSWYLDRSIPLIAKQTMSQDDWELIIVDDGSIDKSEQIIQKYKKMNIIKNFHYIKNTKQRYDSQGGCSITCNIAIKESLGDYILHTDPEIMMLPDWAEQHYNSHEGKHNKNVWGRCLHPRELHIINDGYGKQYKGAFLGNAHKDYKWIDIKKIWNMMNEKIKIIQKNYNLNDSIINNEFFNDYQAGFSISKKLLIEIGGYEENFCNKELGLDKYGGEDVVFFHHLKNIVSVKIYNPNIKAIHIYHPKEGQNNVATTYAWKYVNEYPTETQSNIGREWGLLEENGFVKVF